MRAPPVVGRQGPSGHPSGVRPEGAFRRKPDAFECQSGSVLLFVLFVCLAAAVSVQVLSTVVLCAERALMDESSGRANMSERDQALDGLRSRALTSWVTVPWSVVISDARPVEGRIALLPQGEELVMEATARHDPALSRLYTSAWLERGRDGIDLPSAALVAGDVVISPGRDVPWLDVDSDGMFGGSAADSDTASHGGAAADGDTGAAGYLCVLPAAPLLGQGCSLVTLADPWRLDPGWQTLGAAPAQDKIEEAGTESPVSAGAYAVAPGPTTFVFSGQRGQTVVLSSDLGGPTTDSPCLALVTGGATLDARGRGDLYGVLVVDGGDVLLEGTTVRGAVFATDTVNLGDEGRVLFSWPVLRWGTDCSLVRVRLVPGTRMEGME